MKKISILILAIVVLSSCKNSVAGNSIVIGSMREGILLDSPKIYAIDENGTPISISPPFSDANEAEWSPDLQWIVYQTEDTAKDTDPQIIIVKSDGTEKKVLTNTTHPCGFEPTWSPDGNQIAAYFCSTDGENGIYTVDISCIGNGQSCVFDYHFIVEGGGIPSWSSDGKQLAFWISSKQIAVVSIESPENIKVISPKDAECYDLDWSPIDDEIAVSC
jgi:Tol biopolymer transport system component